MATNRLTGKQSSFVEEFLVDLNAAAAARRAGYSERCAAEIGHENLRKPHVQAAIQAEMEKRSSRTAISGDYVLENLKRVADRCLQVEKAPSGQYRFDAPGACRALELIGKHLKLFSEKVETQSDIQVKIMTFDGDYKPEKTA